MNVTFHLVRAAFQILRNEKTGFALDKPNEVIYMVYEIADTSLPSTKRNEAFPLSHRVCSALVQ